jgi:hypothetical protein
VKSVNVNESVNEPEKLITQRSQRGLLSPYHRGAQRKIRVVRVGLEIDRAQGGKD